MFSSSLTAQKAALAVLVLSLATICGAWGFQLIGGYLPCPLCLQQRMAYYAVIPLAGLAIVLARRSAGPAALILILCALAMIANAGIGIYQAGAEWGFWPGPQACAGGGGLSGGLPDLDNAVVVRCDEAQLRILGLSFAGWNVVISLTIATLAIIGARLASRGRSLQA